MILILACKKPYNPPAITSKNNYLVVEGQINTGPDSTIINLSRTVNLSAKTTLNPELNAIVTVEDNQNRSYIINEIGKGKYAAPGLNLPATAECRLRIKTANGKTYLSDFITPKITPPIDSIGFVIQKDGIQIYLNTHDPTANSRYYRWDYNETYIFHAFYDSYYKIVDGKPKFRGANESVYQCWRSDTSSTIVLNSSAKLAQDVIYQTPITFLPSTSEKLEDRYSILVKQFALTPVEFDYYQNLKKNTQELGSIFDAQPSQLQGNIQCVSNPSEPVIGYITAGTIAEKRIFIDSRYLPAWHATTFYDTYGCAIDTITVKDSTHYPYFYGTIPPLYLPTTLPSAAAYPICVDCSLRGTLVKPVFWK
ncbi:DUF4249 domain-containing protein [Mucilaginibacter sp. McL0603]|uniref:DUF4249 domain-containing protein n=1 Tax=Mucilaginibacter sp. McL0603 TaxID=3415670 RepID=UPI003CE8905E